MNDLADLEGLSRIKNQESSVHREHGKEESGSYPCSSSSRNHDDTSVWLKFSENFFVEAS
jgi:hypothetical protein